MQGAKWRMEEIVREVEAEKSRAKTREEEKASFNKVQSESAIRARKALNLSVVEARAIYNRLNTQALCDLVSCYKEFASESLETELEGILALCCCGEKKARELLELVRLAARQEEIKDSAQQQTTIEEIESKYFSRVGEAGKEKDRLAPEDVRVIYLYLPYLATPFLEDSPVGDKLRQLIGFSGEEMEVITELVPVRTMLDLMDHYRHNKECKKWGLFSPEQLNQLHTEFRIPVEKLLNFVQIVNVMCREALLVPPSFFALATDSFDQKARSLDLSQFGELFLSCAAISGLFAYVSEKAVPVERLLLAYSSLLMRG